MPYESAFFRLLTNPGTKCAGACENYRVTAGRKMPLLPERESVSVE